MRGRCVCTCRPPGQAGRPTPLPGARFAGPYTGWGVPLCGLTMLGMQPHAPAFRPAAELALPGAPATCWPAPTPPEAPAGPAALLGSLALLTASPAISSRIVSSIHASSYASVPTGTTAAAAAPWR